MSNPTPGHKKCLNLHSDMYDINFKIVYEG